MLPNQKNKTNLKILGMLRERGAPQMTPFPGEQDFQSTDLDLDEIGDVLVSGPTSQEKPEELKRRRRKIRQDDPERFASADEIVSVAGTN